MKSNRIQFTSAHSRDGALRRPRRVQQRNAECDLNVRARSFRPLDAAYDIAA